MVSYYQRIPVRTSASFEVIDITGLVQGCVKTSGIAEGIVVVSSLHTTVAVTVNENEARLLDDLRDHCLRLAPPDSRYRHNDLHLRDCPPDEPENAHAHLIAMMLGNSEVLPVHLGWLDLGRWQSLLLVELDGPRPRQVAIQIVGE